jgi:hypothetical protein
VFFAAKRCRCTFPLVWTYLVRVETDRENDLWTWCLYELKDDTLGLCQDVRGKGRPKEFKATADTTIVTFKRIKQ